MIDMFALFAVLAAGQTAAGGQAPAPPPPPPPAVKVGEQAPDFTLSYLGTEDGKVGRKEVTLSSYRGKQNVVLAFFPAAFSPGWTTELSRYRENAGKFNETNTQVFGISVDSAWANKAFREQLGIDFPILSDGKRDVARKYGVLDEENGVARRTTFVIDTNGVVQHIDQAREALDPQGAVGVCQRLHKK
jgi:peroxiredoxin